MLSWLPPSTGCPWQPDDTKSGARFERMTIAGDRYVLKYQDPKDDWLLRATGDPGARYVRLWEEGILDRLPAVIDSAVVAASFDGAVGRVLLRDVTDALLPPGTSRSGRPSTNASSTTWRCCTPSSGVGRMRSA